MADHHQQLADFQKSCRDRMDQGLVEYGDKSFSADPATLVGEVQQELEDVANWSFILWTRVKALQAALDQLKE